MVNPFTVQAKVIKIQQDVLRPLYTMHPTQEKTGHSWLLVETGRAIGLHQNYIEEICRSRLIAAVFKIVRLLGGAEQLTEDDFSRFTAYVNDGGVRAMVKMLLSADREKTFVDELQRLPLHVQKNAPIMLEKSSCLHSDFISGFFKENYGSVPNCPQKLRENFSKSNEFIRRLASLARENQKKIS